MINNIFLNQGSKLQMFNLGLVYFQIFLQNMNKTNNGGVPTCPVNNTYEVVIYCSRSFISVQTQDGHKETTTLHFICVHTHTQITTKIVEFS